MVSDCSESFPVLKDLVKGWGRGVVDDDSGGTIAVDGAVDVVVVDVNDNNCSSFLFTDPEVEFGA
jgi:hypothetical protein